MAKKETGEDILRTIMEKGGKKASGQAEAALGVPKAPAKTTSKLKDVSSKVKGTPSSKPGMLGKAGSLLGRGAKGLAKGVAAGALGVGALVGEGIIAETGAAPFLAAGALGYKAAFGGRGSEKAPGGPGAGGAGGGGKGGGDISVLAGILNQLVSISNSILSAVEGSSNKLEDVTAAIDSQTQAMTGEIRQTNDLLKQINASILGMSSGGKSGSDKGAGGTDWLDILKGVGLALAATLGGILGFLKGYLRPLEEFGKFLASTFEKLFKGLGTVAEDAIGMFKSIFSGEGVAGKIGKVFTTIVDAVKDFLAPLEKVGTFLSDIFAKTGELLKAVVEPFVSAFKYIGSLVSGAGEFAGTIGKFMPFLEKLIGVFSFALKWMEPIGWIVMAIQGAYAAITGAIEGYKEGGIAGAIGGAVKGLFDSLIAAPLDLIKDFVSWMLELFGWDSASKALDSFSFAKMFDNLIDGIGTMVKNIVSSIYDFFTSIPSKLMDMVGSLIPSGLKSMWKSVFGGSGETVSVQSNRSSEVSKDSSGVSSTSTGGTIVENSALGSTAVGALLTPAGQRSGGFTGTEVATSNKQTQDNRANPQTTSVTAFSGRRISGGLFGSDTYKVMKGGVDVEMGKKDYFAIQDLVSSGKIKEASDMLDKIQADNATKASNQSSVGFDAAGNMVSAGQDVNFAGVPNASSPTLNQQSSQMAVQNATPAAAPVIINNNNTTNGGGGNSPPPPPRTSGAVMTAPVSSHIDRALYGDLYGAGVP